MEPKEYPLFEQLKPEQQDILLALLGPGGKIDKCELRDTWEDDHIDCVGLEINDVRVGLWWCGPEMAGYVECATESTKARQRVRETLAGYVVSGCDDISQKRFDEIKERVRVIGDSYNFNLESDFFTAKRLTEEQAARLLEH